jgi:carbon monoxide dehydrogenase subunit G
LRISERVTFAAERERVWEALLDFDLLARTLPGLQSFEPVTPDRCEVAINVLVPSITGTYRGAIEVVDREHPESYRLLGNVRGRLGWVRGDARFVLADAPAADETVVDVELDFQAGGMLASVGQRFVEGAARSMLNQFFASFERELAGARA